MSTESRRKFLAASGKLFVGAATFGSAAAYAARGHQSHGSGEGLAVDAGKRDICINCEFWGGMRKVSGDRKEVFAQSMGWCNNPDSPNYQKLTSADHQMKKPGIWKKWAAL